MHSKIAEVEEVNNAIPVFLDIDPVTHNMNPDGIEKAILLPIESPEEVANPHNLFVQAAADWGIPGLVGMLNLNASMTKAGIRYSTLWSERFDASARNSKVERVE